jgi:hypothetical protein
LKAGASDGNNGWRPAVPGHTLRRGIEEEHRAAMSEVFVICNQLGHYWSKGKAWVDGRDPRAVQRCRHRDEAVNLLFELSAKNIELRGEVIGAELSPRGEPVLAISQIPLPPQQDAATDGAEETAPATGEPSQAAPTDSTEA